jgi:hypothetical protein
MFTLRETQANETSVEIIAELALTLRLSKHGKLFFNSLFTFDIHAIVGGSAKDERSVLRFCQESFL